MDFGWWIPKDHYMNVLYNPQHNIEPENDENEVNILCLTCGESEWYCLCANPCLCDIPSCINLPPLFCNEDNIDENLETLAPASENFVLHASSSHESFKVDHMHDSEHVDCEMMVENVYDLNCETEISEQVLNEKSDEQGEVEEEGSFEVENEEIPCTTEEKEDREEEQELKIAEIGCSALFFLTECIGDVENFSDLCPELDGYIIIFEQAPISQYPPPYEKFLKIKEIELKRKRTKRRRKFLRLFEKTSPWDTFVWDPGGF